MSTGTEKDKIKQQWLEIAEKLKSYSILGNVEVEVKTPGLGDSHCPTNVVLLREVSETGQELLKVAMRNAGVLRYKNGPEGERGEQGDAQEQFKYYRAIAVNKRIHDIKETDYHVAAADAAPLLDAIKTNLDELITRKPAKRAVFFGDCPVDDTGANFTASLKEHIPDTGENADPYFERHRADAIAAIAAASGVTPASMFAAMQRVPQKIDSQDQGVRIAG